MNLRKRIGTGLIVAMFTGVLSPIALADVIYDVSDTSVVNCSSAPHGLWTNNDTGGGSCSNYYSMQAGSTLTIFNNDPNQANWTAALSATAENPNGVIATINLNFSQFLETSTFKAESGNGSYSSNPGAFDSVDLASASNVDIDFFKTISGTIAFSDVTNVNVSVNPISIVSMVGNYSLQFGMGANAKSASEFGASAWIQTEDMTGNDHWDLNLKLAAVPAPSMLILLSIALLNLGLVRRRTKFRK